MRTAIVAAALAGGLITTSAGAVTFVATDGGMATFASSADAAQYTFETPSTGNTGNPDGFVRAGGLVMNGMTEGVGANPFGSPAENSYLFVTSGLSTTISAVSETYQAISFYIGSIDEGNTVEILGEGGAVIRSYNGTELASPMNAGGAADPAGDQPPPDIHGRRRRSAHGHSLCFNGQFARS